MNAAKTISARGVREMLKRACDNLLIRKDSSQSLCLGPWCWYITKQEGRCSQWAVGSGRRVWAVGSGQWEVGSGCGQWAMAVGGGQWAVHFDVAGSGQMIL